MLLKKIVIIGPESTGKSTLCEQLAKHYHTHWVKEYARQYLLQHGKTYTFENLLDIAKGQIALEEAIIENSIGELLMADHPPHHLHRSPIFIDTDMYVMKVWCEFVFDKCHSWILNQIAERKYDLYLLCNTDIPWVKDELREYPDIESRQQLYHIYKDAMINQHTPWTDISGLPEERLQKAIEAVDKLLHH
ncbi:MAG: AAA family ATPase [Sphingobacteriales bacterium]|nr:AAA family ATPase [Sphingobacteriales bacterium]